MNLTTLPNGTTIATIASDTHIGKWAIEAGRLDHDQNTLPLLAPFIPVHGTVVDAGAFIGDHTVFYAACVGPRGNVFAFEPNPEAFVCLHYNTKDMPVTSFRAGLSDRSSTASVVKEYNAGASHLEDGEGVALVAIDSINLHELHFLKLDIEGFEVKALKGATMTIHRHKPVMLIEVNEAALHKNGTTPDELKDTVKAMGYVYRNVYEGQPCEGTQYDILCLPK